MEHPRALVGMDGELAGLELLGDAELVAGRPWIPLLLQQIAEIAVIHRHLRRQAHGQAVVRLGVGEPAEVEIGGADVGRDVRLDDRARQLLVDRDGLGVAPLQRLQDAEPLNRPGHVDGRQANRLLEAPRGTPCSRRN